MTDKHLAELQAVLASTSALLSHLSSPLSSSPSEDRSSTANASKAAAAAASTTNSSKPAPNALALCSTAASLIKAQTTKLSLLVINKPFTPSAICTILKTLASECIPALITGVQLAGSSSSPPSTPSQHLSSFPSPTINLVYPHLIYTLLKQDASTILREFDSLLREVPTDERGISTAQNRGRDALASTGVIWTACDSIVSLGEVGVRAAAVQKATEARDLVADAIDELTEWLAAEGSDDEEEEDDDGPSHSGDEGDSSGKGDSILNLLGGGSGNGASETCPSRLRPTAETALKLAQHIRLLFPPLTKRRLKRFPELTAKTKFRVPAASSTKSDTKPDTNPSAKPSTVLEPVSASESGITPTQAIRLDTLLEDLASLSTELDEVAGLLYEGQSAEEVRSQMGVLVKVAGRCADVAELDWAGGEDELTGWVRGKWRVVMGEVVAEIERLSG